MKNSRRNFLQITSLGFLATILPIPVLASGKRFSTPNSILNFNDAKLLAQKAKQYFYKKEYLKAEGFYKKCIELVPTNIAYYDNLKAVYGAQGKYIASLELFKTGLTVNPENIAFYDRTARCLMQLELGNKKMATTYKNGSTKSLLKDARKLYKDAIEIDPSAQYLKVGLKKVKRKSNEQNNGIDYRLNKNYKGEKKKNIRKHKMRFNAYSIEELENQLVKLDSKKRTELFITKDIENRKVTCLREKALILSLLEKKYRNSGDISSAVQTALIWHNLAPKDSEAVKKLLRLYKKSNDYEGLINFRRKQTENDPRIWSYLGLIKAIQLGHRKGLNVSLEETTVICDDLLSSKWRVIGALKITILDVKAKSLLKQNKKNKAKQVYEDVLQKEQINSTEILNRIINGYALVLLKKNELEIGEEILKAILYEEEGVNFEIIPEFIKNKIVLAEKSPKKQLIPLYCSLYRIYKKQGLAEEQQKVVNDILAINPEDKFAKKRS